MDRETRRALFKIAKAYYEDELTQEQIGERLGLSRVKVSRMLQQAREAKIVQITVISPQDSNVDLERAIETRYGLDEAVIVSPASSDPSVIVHELGPPAAQCLVRYLQGVEVLGLTWGTTLLPVIEALPAQNWPAMRVVQMLGGLGSPEADIYGADLARRTAGAFGAKLRIVPAPGIVSSRMVRDALLGEPQIADALALAARADVALVGIGQPGSESVVTRSGILSEATLQELRELGAVGDIGLRFFDAAGCAVEHEIDARIIGLTLGQIHQIGRVIGVAGGPDKHEAIRAALHGGLIDVLVTDRENGGRLLAG